MGTSADALRSDRNENLRRSLATSVVARLAGILLQVLSLPLAAAALGTDGFSAYSMLGAVLAWLSLSNLGIGQAATLHMAREADPHRRVTVFFTSWVIVLAVSMGVFVLSAILLFLTPISDFLFSNVSQDVTQLQGALLFVCLVFLITQSLSVFESAQLAFQQQHFFNKSVTAGTLISAILVLITSRYYPTVLNVLLAVHLPVLFFRLLNAKRVWIELRPSPNDFSRITKQETQPIICDGLRFLSGATISNFLCHPLPILIIGILTTSLFTASFSAVMNAVILGSAVFGMLISPFRGALPEAARSGDGRWVWRMYGWSLAGSLCYALFPLLIFTLFGQRLFQIWYQGSISPERPILIGAGIYMMCLAIEVINYNFLTSLGKLARASRWMIIKSILTALAVWSIARMGQPVMTFYVLCFINVIFSLIPLSAMIVKLYGETKGALNA